MQALADYAAQAGKDERVLRRLFAEDAERGFAFIDLSRARYDVVLMNPPFGQPADGTKDALDVTFPACGHEIYAMFFQRALELLESHGSVGAITNRTWLALKWLRGLRESVFDELGAVTLGADLGYGVLEAKVETCSVVVDCRATPDTSATWVRLLRTRQKGAVLQEALQAAFEKRAHPYVYQSAARRFRQLPEGVYAYWMSDALLDHYTTSPTLEKAVGPAKQGTATAKDFRFLRLAWEIEPARIGLDAKWARFAKGGVYRPFWDDIYLVVNWGNDASEIAAFPKAYIRNAQYIGRRGVTWPRRTSSGFGPRVFNNASAFGDKGPTAFSRDPLTAPVLLAVLASGPGRLLLSIRLAAADNNPAAMAKSYEVSLICDLPWPEPSQKHVIHLSRLTERAIALTRSRKLELDPSCETWVAFDIPPALCFDRSPSLVEVAKCVVAAREDAFVEISNLTAEIDDMVAEAYRFTERDRQILDEEHETPVAGYSETAPDEELFRTAYLTKEALPGDCLPGGLDAAVDVRVEHRRKRQHKALRTEEDLCRLFEIPPRRLTTVRRRLDLLRDEDIRRCAADIFSWAVGLVFGRWDYRLLDHPDWIPQWPDPFGPLPRCPLGQLVDASGLPATPSHIVSEAWLAARINATALPQVEKDEDGVFWILDSNARRTDHAETEDSRYPVPVVWDGVLQDDSLDDDEPSRHLDDLYRRVSQVLELVYGEAHAEREAELAEALGVESLVTWLRDPKRFFANHLARYRKSRRIAPIYWPLSTASGGFTLWLYYPRLSKPMLSGCVNRLRDNDEVLRREEAGLLAARSAGSIQDVDQDRLDRLPIEIRERAELREALRGLVDGGFEPYLDDGAVVNAAPLARWFRNRTWSEAAEKVWVEVQKGEHDWSHLALWLRHDEVLARCRKERDLAIAHGREDLYVPPPTPKKRRGRPKKTATQLTMPGPPGGV